MFVLFLPEVGGSAGGRPRLTGERTGNREREPQGPPGPKKESRDENEKKEKMFYEKS